ncbi:MAG TPA: sensor histidine kinase, partial [Ktedonobacterales bacterium]|nr:sensor histidine kinase [Ktedonobacterales bacterium]
DVRDHGPGIAESDLPHLFTRFFQVARSAPDWVGGLGLGLYIAQEIAQAHDGRITVESQRGEGTTFSLRLPLAPARAGRAEKGEKAEKRT